MAENYSFHFKDDSLSHHGIEGQQWGVRNGPPYPLGSGQHSRAEVRAMKKENKEAHKSLKRAVKKGGRMWNLSRFDKNLSNIVSSKIQENKDEYFNLIKNSNKSIDYIVDFEHSPEYEKYVDRDLDRSIEKGWIKKEDRDRMRQLYFVDDLGQNLYEEWLDEHPDKFKEYSELQKESDKAEAELKNKLLDISKTTLGKYADQKITTDGYWKNDSASDILSTALYSYLSDLYWAESK